MWLRGGVEKGDTWATEVLIDKFFLSIDGIFFDGIVLNYRLFQTFWSFLGTTTRPRKLRSRPFIRTKV